MKSGFFGRTGGRFPAPGEDPHFANVVALLHMDGADGSTSFIDEKGNLVTPNGAVELDTARFKFGSASGLFAGGYLSLASSVLNLNGDFTIEGWIYPTTLGTDRHISGVQMGGNELRFYLVSDGRLAFTYNGVNGNGGSVSLNNWHHVAITRASTDCRVFLNGNLLATFTAAGAAGTGSFIIGARASTATPFSGSIDEFRLTQGVARYTANFTPPSAAFPNS